MGPGQGPPGSGGSREARAAARCVREPQRPPPLPVCGRTGLFLAAPPRTEVTRRSARRGRASERAKRRREGMREGGRGRDSASDVIGSPSASQGGKLNQKNQSGACERERDVRREGQRGREAAGRTGPGPAAAAPGGKIRAALPLDGIRELHGEPVSTCQAKKKEEEKKE